MAIFRFLCLKMGFGGFPGVVTYGSRGQDTIESVLSSFRGYFGFYRSFNTAQTRPLNVRRVLAENRFFDYISKS